MGKLCGSSYYSIIMRMGQQWLKKSIKVESPLGEKGKTLQEPRVTSIPEQWDSSQRKCLENYRKMCSTQRNNNNG